jgi:hypothetical protein
MSEVTTTTPPAAPAPTTPPPAAPVTPPAPPAPAPATPPAEPPKDGAPAPGTEPPKPPEKYELKLPEGTKLPPARVQQIETYAKEKGLTQEQAQAALERDAVFHDELVSAHQKQVEGWKSALQSDPIYGGQKYQETADLAHKAAKTFFDEATFKELFEDLQYGWHPGLAKGLAEIGRKLVPTPLAPGDTPPSAAPIPRSHKYYGPSGGKVP